MKRQIPSRPRLLRLLRLLPLFLLLAVPACSGATADPEVFSPNASLTFRDLSDYAFDFQRECFCVEEAREPVRIRVRNRAVVEVRSRTSGQAMPLPGLAPWPTLVELFRQVDEARAAGTPVTVAYDVTGFPTRVEIGSLAADAGVVYHLGRYGPD